ncbi:MAG: class I SAM-dependent methyltransferase [Acidimicrobiales bacterium]
MIHRAATSGFSTDARRYDSARPAYHPELVQRFVDDFGAGRVLEIAAGTGIFTGQLATHGIDIVAIEPVEAMRAALTNNVPSVEVRTGTAEHLPIENASVDVVAVAQAFHWFDHLPALDEIHRVLQPGGHLVTIWNVKDGDAAWYRRYMEIVDRHTDDTPRHADMRWRRAIDDDQRFVLVKDCKVDNSQLTDQDGIIERALSTSFIAALPPEQQTAVASEIKSILGDVDMPVSFPYQGELQAWQKTT